MKRLQKWSKLGCQATVPVFLLYLTKIEELLVLVGLQSRATPFREKLTRVYF